MRVPSVLVAGMPGSGASRVFQIIQDAGVAEFGGDDFVGQTALSLPELERATASATPGVRLVQEWSPKLLDTVRAGTVILLATVRTPVDAMTEAAREHGWSTREVLDRTDRVLAGIEAVAWAAPDVPRENVRIVGYDTASSNNLASIRGILQEVRIAVPAPVMLKLAFRWSKPAERSRELDRDDLAPAAILHRIQQKADRQPFLGDDLRELIHGAEDRRLYSRVVNLPVTLR